MWKFLQTLPSVSETHNMLGKGIRYEKHEKCFLYSLSSLLRGHSSAGADTGTGWTDEAEEGEQMCRFRWERLAVGKCATFV